RIRIAKNRRRERRQKLNSADRQLRATTSLRKSRKSSVFIPPPKVLLPQTEAPRLLQRPQNCYVCKKEYLELHFFYDAMCRECGDFNYQKRGQSASLEGWVALITGSRLKIGYQAALMVLRAGARVIATTRFPHDAAKRFSSEPDFE